MKGKMTKNKYNYYYLQKMELFGNPNKSANKLLT